MEPIEQGLRGGKRAREEGSRRGQSQSNSEDDEESDDEDFAPQHSARAQTPEREGLAQRHRLGETSHGSGESLLKQEEPKPQEPSHSYAERRLRPKTILATGTSTRTSLAPSARLSPIASHNTMPLDIPGARLASAASHGTLPVDIPGAHVPQVGPQRALPMDAPRARNMSWLLPAATALCPSTCVTSSNPGITWATMPAGVVPASAGLWATHLLPPHQQHHQPQATSQGMYGTPVLRLACMI
mmetsp:Transcript_70779/g.136561  ORF Transcript_70779/g.136561 Transcript_70779/m.136561 type:complete len:243 (+) Transcript_70779:3-731(+)